MLTDHVLRVALRECSSWHAAGHEISVSVNVSVRSIYEDGFVDSVARALRETGVAGRLLTVEVTESMMLTDPARRGGPGAAARDRRPDRHRRLRDGVLIAGVPQAPARRRVEDRPVLRRERRPRRRRPGHRSVHRRPRTVARSAIGGGRRRRRRHAPRARVDRLRPCTGLPPEWTVAERPLPRLARRVRGQRPVVNRSYSARATPSGSHEIATSSSSLRARSRFTDPYSRATASAASARDPARRRAPSGWHDALEACGDT